jgi:serine/threonine-protein kinase RsbW/stage II sporulation protein AB (anti-sigma F factor)
MRVPATADQLARVRAAVGTFVAEHWPAADRDGADIALVLTEACANVIRHAYPDGEGHMTVTCRIDDHLALEISDQGTGMGPPSPNAGLGLGLPLMHRLADANVWSDGSGTHISLRFSP